MDKFSTYIGYGVDTYRKMMRDIKESEKITPKEYGMMLQKSKKKRKVIKKGK